MGVTVKNDGHLSPDQRFRETGRAEKGKYLFRFAFDRIPDRRIVQEGDLAEIVVLLVEAGEGPIEAKGIVDRFLDEGFHGRFAEHGQHIIVEAAAKAFDTGEAQIADSDGLTVENVDLFVLDDLADGLLPAFFVVVVAEHGDNGDTTGLHFFLKHLRFPFVTCIREVAADKEDIGLAGSLPEQIGPFPMIGLFDVDIGDGGNAGHIILSLSW